MLDDDKGGLTRSSLAGVTPEPTIREERRSGQRHMSILRVGKMITARGEDFCLIRNISDGGLMARTYRPVEPGEHVVVELRGERKLGGTIRWVRDDSAGMQFDHPIDVAAILADRDDTTTDGRRPRAPRLARSCRATLRVGAHYHRVTVRDVSQGGVKVSIPTELAADSAVVVTMEGFRPVPGVIRWWKDNNAGIAFNEVIPYPELTSWLREYAPE